MATVLLLVVLPALFLGFVVDLGDVRDWFLSSDKPRAVAILQEGSTSGGEPRRTWTVIVAKEQMLIINALSVELVRTDEGSRIDNANPDRILIAAEGGHPYTVTIGDGRWVIVAEVDGRHEVCNQRRSQDHAWGVRYLPSSWPSDLC